MRCIITGHTSGIGKAIYEHFSSRNWSVYGMSRSNGYDIIKDQDKIVRESIECDIFVNCAYDGTGQLELLNKLHDQVKNMIVIGSVAADWSDVWKDYGKNKFDLQERCRELSLKDDKNFANIFYLKLAFCENASWPIFIEPEHKASFQEILKVIDLWLEIPKIFSVEFTLKKTSEITDCARKMNYKD